MCVVRALGKSRWFHYLLLFYFLFAFAAEENVLGVSEGFWKSFLNSERAARGAKEIFAEKCFYYDYSLTELEICKQL